MKIHHLNCGTMRPLLSSESLVCHVVLIEQDRGLMLVDTGFGSRDAEEWRTRLGSTRTLLRPVYDPSETVVAQIEALGLDPGDVSDVVLTHFDADHVGGLVDVPQATVHLGSAEQEAVQAPRTFLERSRYLAGPRAHGPRLLAHEPGDHPWFGFEGVRAVPGSDESVLLVPMPGHTRGHCAVAVRVDEGDRERWVLHVGDTFYHRGQVGDADRTPRSIAAMGRASNHDMTQVLAQRERLRDLVARPDREVMVVSGHDPVLLKRARELAAQ